MSNELLNISKAFNTRLKALDTNFPTAYENDKFKPTKGVAYQRIKLAPSPVSNPTLGDQFYREEGQFQIFLCYPIDTGTGEVMQKAHAIRADFSRGTTLVYGGTEVIVKRTPQISQGFTSVDRYVVPVIIEYFANILDV